MKPHSNWKAIVAMSENRVMGKDGGMPWHLPEDFRWFKQATMGHTIAMGRKTFHAIGRALPGRRNIVITRSGESFPGADTFASVEALEALPETETVFIIGGAEIFRQTLPKCGELFLSYVRREVDGDVFLPEFETDFELESVLADYGEFEIRHYLHRGLKG